MTSRGALRVFELYYDVAVILHAGTSPWVHAMTKSRGRKPVATQWTRERTRSSPVDVNLAGQANSRYTAL